MIAFHESKGSEHDFVDLTHAFSKREAFDITDIVDHLPCAWTTFWKVEVRYSFRGAKFRAVVRNGQSFAFPPCSDIEARSINPGRGVLCRAFLETVDPPGGLDITARVAKYQGVCRDYGGRLLECHDLFPFDDHDHDAGRFGILTIDTLGIVGGRPVFSAQTYDYANNDVIFEQP